MDSLPFEVFRKILIHLDVAEVIRSRLVSRKWCAYVDNHSVSKLFCSGKAKGQIYGKKRLISGQFERNFIKSSNFQSLFSSFGESIFSNLKHLRLCDLNIADRTSFAQLLNSFGQLEDLDLIQVTANAESRDLGDSKSKLRVKLTLPSLQSIEFENLNGINELALDAPKLGRIRLWQCSSLRLHIVHAESVERLSTDYQCYLKVEKLKNLEYLYISFSFDFRSTLLSSLEHLKEIHVDSDSAKQLYCQKQQYNRADLKIYHFGLLLNGPSDPIHKVSFGYFDERVIDCYVQNYSRLADEVLFYMWFDYEPIERALPNVQVNIWRSFVKMNDLRVDSRVSSGNVQRFLNFLKNFDSIETLSFLSKQPQELFDQLPDYCSVQQLIILNNSSSDLRFLLKLPHLIDLSLGCEVDAELICGIYKQLKFLSNFSFRFNQSSVRIKIDQSTLFEVTIGTERVNFSNSDDAVHFLISN